MNRNYEILDGNKAAAQVSYMFSDCAFVYPITPATPMAEAVEALSVKGKSNLFNQTVSVKQMQSEAGVAAAMHGCLASGSLCSTYTASQGLLLMVPNIYKMAAEHLPGVIYVASRSIATHALSIFGDHSDIYSTRQTGACIFSVSNVQEVMDLAPVAHLSAVIGRLPVIFTFDGFRTSHELQKIKVWSKDDLKSLLPDNYINSFRSQALNPNHPKLMGSAQNPDIYFQVREASNLNYISFPEVLDLQLDKVNSLIGTSYRPYEYYGSKEPEHVIVAMGSVIDTIKQTIDHLNMSGNNFGVINVRLFRPFSASKFVESLPLSTRFISVLDKTKEPGSAGEPLYKDVLSALSICDRQRNIKVLHGRYGLASKDTTPEQIESVYKNTQNSEFTIGIYDDVTKLSLPVDKSKNSHTNDVESCLFYGHAQDGTISAVQTAAKIIGENTSNFVQVYSQHDSKISGSLTVSHLRFGNCFIKRPYLIDKAHLIVCNHIDDVDKYIIVDKLQDNSTLLLNSNLKIDEINKKLSSYTKKGLIDRNVRLFTINATDLSQKIGLKNHINTILICAALYILDIMPKNRCEQLLKEYININFKDYGKDVIDKNIKAIDITKENLIQLDVNLLDTNNFEYSQNKQNNDTDFWNHIQKPISKNQGDKIPVSHLLNYSDGSLSSKENCQSIDVQSNFVVEWDPSACLQCNHCSFVCSASAIRPYILTENEVKHSSRLLKTAPLTGNTDYKYTIGISAKDCCGCKTCISVCPSKGKALKLVKNINKSETQIVFDYLESLPKKETFEKLFKKFSVKGSQFKKPLMQFPQACGGCGETPYAKLLTQLFGEQMYIANATGCSSIWGNSMPYPAYTVGADGKGPVWSNSLFEDAAEFGYGMMLTQKHIRKNLKNKLIELKKGGLCSDSLNKAIDRWLETFNDTELNSTASESLCLELDLLKSPVVKEILQKRDFLSKKSVWVFGGDGWAYDIGFGGLDHVLLSGENINVLVFDTECYSNTGGQVSKATPYGAIAKLASDGKTTYKKNLAKIFINYEDVYVASVSMGADMSQCIKAFTEAERYNGPSIVVAYAPCKQHKIKVGTTQQEQFRAVECGYWNLFRYDPTIKNKNKRMKIDSHGDPKKIMDFLNRENRFNVDNYSSNERGSSLLYSLKNKLEDEVESLNNINRS